MPVQPRNRVELLVGQNHVEFALIVAGKGKGKGKDRPFAERRLGTVGRQARLLHRIRG